MSMRIKVMLTIVLTAITIVVFGMGSGLVFVRGNLEKTIESDMTVVANIADGLITNAVNLLKADASAVSQHLLKASPDEFQSVLKSNTEIYDNFIALAVFDRNGIVASYGITGAGGSATTPGELIHSTYMQKAFAGKKTISTSQMNSNGELVFYVCVPMGERVLSATVPGLFFSKILSSFKIWETGNIFMLDAEGINLANIRTNWVLERFSVIEKAKTDTQYKRVAETISRMIEGRPGSGMFFLDGKERLCVYTPITGSSSGWMLGVVAPLEESPLHDVRNGLLLVGVVCLLLSVIAALFASIILVRPYKTIEALLVTLEAQKKLLYTINDAATALLGAEAASFESDIWKCMGMMARCAGIDRMRVWQNHTKDGELYCSQ
ncbi:MAG: histidine kinase, partial [Deltaproteobacteria bacterium]|nr:histidine kinase [Deltaproteobacteria bacterium]